MERKPIKVLVVEDSVVAREHLIHLLESDPAIRVIGTAHDGEQAVDFLRLNKPDVITMDINMPRMDGFEATRRIMETQATPVIIVTASTDPKQVATNFQAMNAGALAILPIPPGKGHPEHLQASRELIRTVKLMSEVKVVRRWPKITGEKKATSPPLIRRATRQREFSVVAIGASTGGPPVLQTILSSLPADFPLPVLVVQHIAAGFLDGFVQWLASSSRIPVHIAAHRQPILPGHVYLAPDGFHMFIGPDSSLLLSDELPENGLRPSVSCLFRSIAKVRGKTAVGILLTGMGKDGADELKQIRNAGGVTIAQSAETCVVNGMPGAAVAMDAATHVLSPDKIVEFLANIGRPV